MITIGMWSRNERITWRFRKRIDPQFWLRQAGGLGMVGQAGFEPTTPSPPDWCATRLRYCPP